jgi:hypothetical protein
MSPAKYIENYCRVSDRRKALYKKIFDKYKLKPDKDEKEEYIDLEVTYKNLLILKAQSIFYN